MQPLTNTRNTAAFSPTQTECTISESTQKIMSIAEALFKNDICAQDGSGKYLNDIAWGMILEGIKLQAKDNLECSCEPQNGPYVVCRQKDNLLHIVRRMANHLNRHQVVFAFESRLFAHLQELDDSEKTDYYNILRTPNVEGDTYHLPYCVDAQVIIDMCVNWLNPDNFFSLCFLPMDLNEFNCQAKTLYVHPTTGQILLEKGDSILHLLSRRLKYTKNIPIITLIISLIKLATRNYNEGGNVFLKVKNVKGETFVDLLSEKDPNEDCLKKLVKDIHQQCLPRQVQVTESEVSRINPGEKRSQETSSEEQTRNKKRRLENKEKERFNEVAAFLLHSSMGINRK